MSAQQQETLGNTPRLTLQERALATGMLHHIGDAALNYTVAADGALSHQNPEFTGGNFAQLTEKFRADPKEPLGWARESLFAIGQDTRLSADKRKDRLGRYLDAFCKLNLKLDHAVFPPSEPGKVHKGVPDYLPDGFIDMGSDPTLREDKRSREQIMLDKAEVFKKYRKDILEIFSNPMIAKSDNDTKKRLIVTHLMLGIYTRMPYAYDDKGRPANNLGGGKVAISSLSEGVCRHQAFAFQTLAQFFGISSRLFKNKISSQRQDGTWSYPEAHVANLVRINGKWFVADVTQPDRVNDGKGNVEWRPGVFKIAQPPKQGEEPLYEGTLKYSGKKKRYQTRTNSYWRVER